MESALRKPFQGLLNIVRFNWHFYILSLAFLFVTSVVINQSKGATQFASILIFSGTLISTIGSLAISYYVYDYSNLYTFNWLDCLDIFPGSTLINIHAGFDESSLIIKNKYPASSLHMLDFYDPKLHTEVSIKRARTAYPSIPETKSITTTQLSLPNQSADFVFLILAAHEIRNPQERLIFFQELKRVLTQNGKVILLEHQRDLYNFMAYSIGFFHFHPEATWKRSFEKSNFTIHKQFKVTPFITAYILE